MALLLNRGGVSKANSLLVNLNYKVFVSFATARFRWCTNMWDFPKKLQTCGPLCYVVCIWLVDLASRVGKRNAKNVVENLD